MAYPPRVPLSKEKAEKHASARGTLYLWRPLPAMMVSRVEGSLTLEGGIAMETFMRKMAGEGGKIIVFNDWDAMTDYDTAARTGLTRASVDLRRSLEAVHLLVSSPLVALGWRPRIWC